MNGEEDYTEEELAEENTWIALTHDLLPDWPFKFYFAKLRSDSDELTELIKDPKEVLQHGYGELGALSDQNSLIGPATRVNTTIFSHDRTLKARLVYMVVAVDEQDKSVSMTSYKAANRRENG